jgi:rubrerythrin
MKNTDKMTTAQLARQVEQLTQELAAERAHSLRLKNDLDAIRSLKKHAKHVFHKRLRTVDEQIQQRLQGGTFEPLTPNDDMNDSASLEELARFDARNFTAYNRAVADSRTLRAYDSAKQRVKKLLRKRRVA